MAQGANTSHFVVSASSGSTGSAPVAATRAGSTSDTSTQAPASRSSWIRRWPTDPAPCTSTVRPSRSSVPKAWRHVDRIAWNTPMAVPSPGSPAPPLSGDRPRTCDVVAEIRSMSGGPVFISAAVTYVPCNDSTMAAYRSMIRARSSEPRSGTSGTASTALPPPYGRPAAACFMLIALDRRSTSRTASSRDGYGFILVPPIAGPSTVECTPTNIQRPGRLVEPENELLAVPRLGAGRRSRPESRTRPGQTKGRGQRPRPFITAEGHLMVTAPAPLPVQEKLSSAETPSPVVSIQTPVTAITCDGVAAGRVLLRLQADLDHRGLRDRALVSHHVLGGIALPRQG